MRAVPRALPLEPASPVSTSGSSAGAVRAAEIDEEVVVVLNHSRRLGCGQEGLELLAGCGRIPGEARACAREEPLALASSALGRAHRRLDAARADQVAEVLQHHR